MGLRRSDDDFFVDAIVFSTCFGEGFAATELGEFEKEVLFMTLKKEIKIK